MSDRRGRIALWLFAVFVAAVHLLAIFEVVRATYSLIDDYRVFAISRIGAWPSFLLQMTADPTAPGAWIYRPFPDAMSWMISAAFREHPGGWHVVMIFVRLVSVGVAAVVARRSASSRTASCAAAAYFAFFPAIPEVNLIRVEIWLTLALALAFLGWIRVMRGGTSLLFVTGFVLATLSKEAVAPILVAMLVFAGGRVWRRSRFALVIASLALLNQVVRFGLIFTDPYSHPSNATSLIQGALWLGKILLLATTNVPLVPLILIAWIVLGFRALLREPGSFALGLTALLLISAAMAAAAPYRAIRYLCPTALFLVPLLALGVDETRHLIGDRMGEWMAIATMFCFAIFGGAQLVAQAASKRATTRADRVLLETAARAMARGQNIVILEDEDFERSFWMRAELVGVDPRWPFLSYVAQQYATHQPVVWPPPPGGPVNLTGLVRPGGRFLMNAGDGLLIPANPRHVPPYPVASLIDFREDDALYVPLWTFRNLARRVNPKFRYVYDLGEVEWPGYSWPLLRRR